MGEIVAVAVVAHQPMVMVPERCASSSAAPAPTPRWSSLATVAARGVRRARGRHARDHRHALVHHHRTRDRGRRAFPGLYTSDEMPRNICDLPYDYPGAPELAKAWHQVGKERQLYTVNVTTPSLPQHYPTINLVHHLRTHGKGLSCGVVQTASLRRLPRVRRRARRSGPRADGRVAILGSGGMSHEFWPLEHDPQALRVRPGARDLVRGARDRPAHPRALGAGRSRRGRRAVSAVPREVSPRGPLRALPDRARRARGRACRARRAAVRVRERGGHGQVHVLFRRSETAMQRTQQDAMTLQGWTLPQIRDRSLGDRRAAAVALLG